MYIDGNRTFDLRHTTAPTTIFETTSKLVSAGATAGTLENTLATAAGFGDIGQLTATPHPIADTSATKSGPTIDPFAFYDQETLPDFSYDDLETGFMYGNTDNVGLSIIHVYSDNVQSENGSVSDLLFGGRRVSFISNETDENGQTIATWLLRYSQTVSAQYSAQEGKQLSINVDHGVIHEISGPDFQAFEDYYYGFSLGIEGDAEGYDIDSFKMSLDIEMTMDWCEETGKYKISLSVIFEYEITDGETVYSDFIEYADEFLAGLDDFDFKLGDDFEQAFQDFIYYMGDAWRDLGEFSDILQAILTELHDSGEFDGVEHLDNPFDFLIDPFA